MEPLVGRSKAVRVDDQFKAGSTEKEQVRLMTEISKSENSSM